VVVGGGVRSGGSGAGRPGGIPPVILRPFEDAFQGAPESAYFSGPSSPPILSLTIMEHPNAPHLPGIHHVTAITGDPQANVDFYAGLLGLRLVKKTVNFDDPDSYHLYYGDRAGHPGTIMTFFAWPGAPRGRQGTGQVTATSFSVPEDSLDYWQRRLADRGIDAGAPEPRFDEPVLAFEDPDGIRLELVGADDPRQPWREGPVPEEHAIRGFRGVTSSVAREEATARLLTETLGFQPVGRERGRSRFVASGAGPAAIVDLLEQPELAPGETAAGTVHHVAWRTPDEAQQLEWQRIVRSAGGHVTPVLDRTYFRSIYFREPGGVLLEIATDPPGFTVDEAEAELGSGLMLPSWHEPRRAEIERHLPPLVSPVARR
jgi:glyoxalase family protein